MVSKILAFLGSINFEYPERLQLLSVVVLLFVLWFVVWSLRLYLRPAKTHGSRYPWIGSLGLWLAIILMLPFVIGAWAKPFTIRGDLVVKRGNAEVIFVVDNSSSMFLKDTGWARVDIAKREISKLLPLEILREGDKASLFILGLAGFPPRIYLTGDLGGFFTEVSRLGRPANLMGNNVYWGSDISSTLEMVYKSMDHQDIFNESGSLDPPQGWRPRARRNRLIIILTDGDFFNGQNSDMIAESRKKLSEVFQELKRRGLKVYPIGIGTAGDVSLISILDDYKKGEDYESSLVNDLKGKTSRLNTANLELLRNLTEASGPFIIRDAAGDASGFIRSVIDGHRSVTVEPARSEDKQDLWLVFLLTALAVFVAGLGRYYILGMIVATVAWRFFSGS